MFIAKNQPKQIIISIWIPISLKFIIYVNCYLKIFYFSKKYSICHSSIFWTNLYVSNYVLTGLHYSPNFKEQWKFPTPKLNGNSQLQNWMMIMIIIIFIEISMSSSVIINILIVTTKGLSANSVNMLVYIHL